MLDELVRDIDVQEVREKNKSGEKIDSIYQDVNAAKKIFKWYLVGAGAAAGIVLLLLFNFIFNTIFIW